MKNKKIKVKSKDVSKKEQGKTPSNRALGTGGDVYAHSVGKILEEASNAKQERETWLGVEAEYLDPTDFVNRGNLNVKRKKK